MGANLQEGDFGIHMLDAIQDEPTYAVVSVTVKTNDKGEPVSDADIDPTDTSERITVSGDKGEVNGRGGANDVIEGGGGLNIWLSGGARRGMIHASNDASYTTQPEWSLVA